MEILFIHWFMAFLGATIHSLKKLAGRKDKITPLSLSKWWGENKLEAIISVLSIIALMLMIDEIIQVFMLQNMSDKAAEYIGHALKIVCFMVGWFDDSIVRFLVGMFGKRLKKKTNE